MNEDDCHRVDRETREDPSKARERVKEFNRHCPDAACEQFSFENGSPGRVEDNEAVVRIHFSPRDFNKDGVLLPAAFSDVSSVGLSVVRDQASEEEFVRAARQRLANLPGHGVASVSSATARDIRGLMYTGGVHAKHARAFAVYDTAEVGLPKHAEVMSIRTSKADRQRLRNLFLARHDVEFRGGLFARSGLQGNSSVGETAPQANQASGTMTDASNPPPLDTSDQ